MRWRRGRTNATTAEQLLPHQPRPTRTHRPRAGVPPARRTLTQAATIALEVPSMGAAFDDYSECARRRPMAAAAITSCRGAELVDEAALARIFAGGMVEVGRGRLEGCQ
jgi:hypothetical protein